jgi:hypothetical protein
MDIAQLIPAETGWKAVFVEPDGVESVSRILGWAVSGGEGDGELVGLIVDPNEPSKIVSAVDASSPDGGTFTRYRFVAPEPQSITVHTPPPPAPAESESTAETVAKGLLRRK